MKSLPGWMLVGAILGGLTVGMFLEGRRREQLGQWKVRVEALDDSLALARRVSARRDTVYVAVTDTLIRTRIRTDSVIRYSGDSIARGTVLEIVHTERAKCDAVILACSARVAARDTTIGLLESRLTLEQKKPGPRRFPVISLGAFVTPEGAVKVGIGVGVRIF
jgi:hypothetical protein